MLNIECMPSRVIFFFPYPASFRQLNIAPDVGIRVAKMGQNVFEPFQKKAKLYGKIFLLPFRVIIGDLMPIVPMEMDRLILPSCLLSIF